MMQKSAVATLVLSVMAAGLCGCGPEPVLDPGSESFPAPVALPAYEPSQPPVTVRAENFVVTPSTGPVTHVAVHNPWSSPYEGTLGVSLPSGWKATPDLHTVTLAPGQTKRFPFAIEKAVDVEANRYVVLIAAVGRGHKLIRRQTVVAASAPYYKPVIDGEVAEWKDSMPIDFVTGGKKTVVRTYWNRRNFCLCVEVQEDKLTVRTDGKTPFDAVQFAIAPREVTTSASPEAQGGRYEFLVAGGPDGARCFRLLAPGDTLGQAARPRALGEALAGAEVAVKRVADVTRYEVAVPFKSMKTMRPTTGREFHFSVLVHDAGVGLRDLGSVMNLAETARKPLAWSRWAGASFADKPPFDSMIEWGFSSSIH